MIGNVPDGWRVEKLDNICQFINGYAFKSSKFDNVGIPIVRIGNLSDNKITLNSRVCYQEDAKLEDYTVLKNDILIAMSGATTGKMAYSDIDDKLYLNQRIGAIRVNQTIVYSKYLFNFLLGKTSYLLSIAGGSAQPNLSSSDIKKLQIPIPPLPQQEKIVKVLDISSALIEKQKELIANYDLFLKSKFIEMFGDPIQNPIKWEVKKLKEISTLISSGSTPKGGRQVYVEKGILFFRSQNVWKNKMLLDDIAYIDEATHLKMKKSSLKHKDILITKTGRFNTENSSLGRAALFLGKDDSANVNGHVYLVRLRKQTTPEFVVYILTTDEYRDYIRRVCVGGIDKRQINKSHLEDFPIIFPPIDLQNEFASIVEQIDTIKIKETKKLEYLETLHSSLMDKAFKGEII